MRAGRVTLHPLRRWHAAAFPRLPQESSPQSKCLRTAVGSVAMRWWHASRGGQELVGRTNRAARVSSAQVHLHTHTRTRESTHKYTYTHTHALSHSLRPRRSLRRLSSLSLPVVLVTAIRPSCVAHTAVCSPCHCHSSWSPPVVLVTACRACPCHVCSAAMLPCCHACSPSAPRWCCVGRAAWRCRQSLRHR